MVWRKRACLLSWVQADSKQMQVKCKCRCAEAKNVAIFPPGKQQRWKRLGHHSRQPDLLATGVYC